MRRNSMNQTNRISIIILTNDRPILLRKALRSIRRQTRKPYEVIIVDDSRTRQEETRRVISEFRALRCSVVRNTEHSIAYGRSAGMLAARGDIVVYLDDDCEAHPAYLEGFFVHFQKKSPPDAVVGYIVNARPDNVYAATQYAFYQRGIYRYFRDASTPSEIRWGRMLDCEVLGIRRTVLKKVGFVMRHRRYRNDDIDLGLRLLARGKTILFDPSIVARTTPRVSLSGLWSAAFWNGYSDAATVRAYGIDLRSAPYPLSFLPWLKTEYTNPRFRGFMKLKYVFLLCSFPAISRIGMVWFRVSHV